MLLTYSNFSSHPSSSIFYFVEWKAMISWFEFFWSLEWIPMLMVKLLFLYSFYSSHSSIPMVKLLFFYSFYSSHSSIRWKISVWRLAILLIVKWTPLLNWFPNEKFTMITGYVLQKCVAFVLKAAKPFSWLILESIFSMMNLSATTLFFSSAATF